MKQLIRWAGITCACIFALAAIIISKSSFDKYRKERWLRVGKISASNVDKRLIGALQFSDLKAVPLTDSDNKENHDSGFNQKEFELFKRTHAKGNLKGEGAPPMLEIPDGFVLDGNALSIEICNDGPTRLLEYSLWLQGYFKDRSTPHGLEWDAADTNSSFRDDLIIDPGQCKRIIHYGKFSAYPDIRVTTKYGEWE